MKTSLQPKTQDAEKLAQILPEFLYSMWVTMYTNMDGYYV
jgi:hypothetical protein